MLRLISVGILALLLCSCAQPPPRISTEELIARYEEKLRLWDEKFEQLPGTPISGLIQAWGEPERLENNEYRWFRDDPIRGGGYYKPDGYTRSSVYRTTPTGVSEHVGYVNTPKERYVAPWQIERWCEIRVTTDSDGIITHAGYDGPKRGSDKAISRAALFPFPKE